jgi:serine/threonine-protein kinase
MGADVTISAEDNVTRLAPGASAAGPSQQSRTPSGATIGSSGWLTSSDSISHGRFPPGTLFDNRFRIIGLLGRGGMGEVYRADDLRLGQPVALKLLPESLRQDPARLAQFHNEARMARQVSHPNVCRVYDIGEAEGLLYLSMEYVDGEDLGSSLRRIGRFPEDKAIEITRHLCAGVAAAHQRGIVHRDLKPANVMLDGTGAVRVMDFGLAAAGQVDSVRAGTPAYMAPEQLLGREVTTRSDIFALGLVIYEIFTGHRAFTAANIGDLVNQHESRAIARPSAIVSGIGEPIERAILRCLEPDPDKRPASALAVSAALPGGDPLAMMLAAGETPSPELVAAAGEGAGLSPRVAWPLYLATIIGMIAVVALAVRSSPLDILRPSLSAEVLAQKAREAIRQIGYSERAGDAEYGFEWNEELMKHVQSSDKPAPQWTTVLSQRPSPLEFWYRQSQDALTASDFHTDLLTPGIVRPDDPPPLLSNMTRVALDHEGRLTAFETIPPQRVEKPIAKAPVDWSVLFTLAGLDQTQFQPTEPLWTWLATSDTRVAWTGTWPGSGRPLRVEAAALGGRPVAFMLIGPWLKPWRMPEEPGAGTRVTVLMLFLIALGILAGAGLLAWRNLRDGRGDQRGAGRLALGVFTVLLALWVCQVHMVASLGLLALFLIAVCTAGFYGVLLWTIYVALEPFVRRQWPQVLVSWTNVLTGHVRDPVVGRDVLIGSALGVGWALMIRILDLLSRRSTIATFPGSTEVLSGLRGALGATLEELPYAIRNVLLYFFLLFVLRIVLRGQWRAAFAFAAFFMVLNSLGGDSPWRGAVVGFLYFGSAAVAVLRWGLVSFVTASLVTSMLFDPPATLDASAWYFGYMLLILGMAAALATWGFYVSVGGRLWRVDPLAEARA